MSGRQVARVRLGLGPELAVEREVALDRHPDPLGEALLVALDRAHRLVEVQPLDPEQGHEHGRQPERRGFLRGRLRYPLAEARDVDPAQLDARDPEVVEDAPELLGRVDQVDEDDRAGSDHGGGLSWSAKDMPRRRSETPRSASGKWSLRPSNLALAGKEPP